MEMPARNRRRRGTDRRQGDACLLPGMLDRRIKAERRSFNVSRLSFAAWSEAAANFYFEHPSGHLFQHRQPIDRRQADNAPPAASAERRIGVDRRDLDIASIRPSEWVDAMSNYYYHFHRS
ncbi:hypothetical protein [Dechloromonas denitrificans]|nr:hypothetical protein [Dechloromonas denitrificans]